VLRKKCTEESPVGSLSPRDVSASSLRPSPTRWVPKRHPPGRQEPLAPPSLSSEPCRCYSATNAFSYPRHITWPVPFQVTVPFSLVPLVKLSCSRWVAGPLFGGDWLARLCWANVVMVLTLP
jgi:hypothetical protein